MHVLPEEIGGLFDLLEHRPTPFDEKDIVLFLVHCPRVRCGADDARILCEREGFMLLNYEPQLGVGLKFCLQVLELDEGNPSLSHLVQVLSGQFYRVAVVQKEVRMLCFNSLPYSPHPYPVDWRKHNVYWLEMTDCLFDGSRPRF